MNLTSKRILAVGLPLTAIAATGIAFAAWTSTGSGVGSATATQDTQSVISGVTVSGQDLYPGATKTVEVKVTNPNAYPIVVTSIASGWSRVVNTTCVAGSVRTDALGTPPANDAGVAVTATRIYNSADTLQGSATSLPAGGYGIYTLTSRMSNDAKDGCKLQTFVIGDSTDSLGPLTATARSAATAQSF